MTKKTLILFIGIIFLASFLRFYQLGVTPPSPNWDEVALGWNAYSLLQTGRDEYGEFLPVVLRSFDDYKPALYTYFIIPFIPLFDVSPLSVRLPSALFGVIGVIASFFLVRHLFKREDLALVASFLLAISPWSLQFSRVAFEAQSASVFNILVVLFFVLGLKRGWFLSIAAIIAPLSVYLYQSEKVFMPLLLLVLVGVYWKELFSLSKKYLVSAFILGLVMALPMGYYILTNDKALTRATSTVAFADQSYFLHQNVQRLTYDREIGNYIGLVFDNRRIEYTKTIISGYVSHFYLNWMFMTGDINRHHAPRMGIFYLFELPFLLIGLYQLAFNTSIDRKIKYLIFGWILIAPIPASVTSGVPHAVRTVNFLPTFQILIALGLITFVYELMKLQLSLLVKRGILGGVALLALFNFVFYMNQYYVQQNYFFSKEWQYGYKELVSYVKTIEGKYEKIVVTNKDPLDQSHMFFLFYLKYSPQKYQDDKRNTSGGFRENHYFDKYEFREFDLTKETQPHTLYIGRPKDIPQGRAVLKKISYLDGEEAIVVTE